MKNLFRAIALSCLMAVIPAQMWAEEPTPSESLTLVKKEENSTTFSFNYPTVNYAGESIVCSSALIAWTPEDRQEGDAIESIHVYSHATICDDDERPTAGTSAEIATLMQLPKRKYYDVITPGNEADYVGHCIIIAPDYEGYGVSKDHPHPYLAERLTAQQVFDAMTYGMQLYNKQAAEQSGDNPLLPVKSDWRTFGIGYSQGAAVTLAFQRLVEERKLADELHFYGSVCGDGPYDLIATMTYYLNDDGTSYDVKTEHRKGFTNYPVVLPLIFNGLHLTNAEVAEYKIEDYLSQQLLDTGVLDWIASKQYDTEHISEMWYNQLQEGLDAHGRHYTPEQMAEMFTSPKKYDVWGRMEKMLTPATFAYLNDPEKMAHVPTVATNAQEALHMALAQNNVDGWAPQHRIQFYHSRGDMVVPYGNYLAYQASHKDLNEMYRINDTFSGSDHVAAATYFFLLLCGTGSFAGDFNWISEGQPSAVSNVSAAPQQLNADRWYMLDGRPLSGRPTTRGIYLHNHRKVVIK